MKKFAILISLLLTMTAAAVHTVYVEHNTEESLKGGDPNGTLINSQGEISLAYDSTMLMDDPCDTWLVNDMVGGLDGGVYLATSGRGFIFKVSASGERQMIYEPVGDGPMHVFSLGFDGRGRLLAGVTTGSAKLLRFENDGAAGEEIFCDDKINYIWSIVTAPNGKVYLATGPEGKVICLESDNGAPEVVFKAPESNLLSLVWSADGKLFAGSGENGLIYRIDPASGQAVVVYDSEHAEISSLVFDEAGNLYAATADASAARPGSTLVLSDNEAGRSHEAIVKRDDNNGQTPTRPGVEEKNDSNAAEGAAQKNNNSEADTKTITAPGTTETADKGSKKEDDSSESRSALARPSMAVPGQRSSANDVYQITRAGFVKTLFSQPVAIMDMAWAGNGELLLATGNEGKLISLDVDTLEAIELYCTMPAPQITSVVMGPESSVFAATGNPARLIKLDTSFAPEGYYQSPAIDAKQVSRWGNLMIDAEIPAGTSIKFRTRSGNTEDAEKGPWNGWTQAEVLADNNAITSPPARFLQYKLELGSDGVKTPLVRYVKLAYITPNLAPKISKLSVDIPKVEKLSSNGKSAAPKMYSVKWEAEDVNQDELTHEVYVRPAQTQCWIKIAKELRAPKYDFDGMTLADGYYEIKVIASDAADNTGAATLTDARVTGPVLIDNTPPEIAKLEYDVDELNCRIRAQAKDELSTLAGLSYMVNSVEEYKFALPADEIFDAQEENFDFSFELPEAGSYLVTLIFSDSCGNKVYHNLVITAE